MDECSSKRAAGGLVTPRKGCGLVLRDTNDNRDQNAQFCNRVGCKGRLNHTKGNQVGCSQQPKSLRSTFRSSNGKEVKSSTRTCSVDNYRSKSFQAQKKIPPQLELESSEASSVQDDTEGSELTLSPRTTQTCFLSDVKETKPREVGLCKVKSSSSGVTPISRPRKILRQNSGLSNQMGLSTPQTSKSTLDGAKNNANSNRYGLRNLRCNSISDVLPSGCSSSESQLNQKKDVMKKRNPEGEGSSARGKRTVRTSAEEGRSAISGSGVSISDSRQARNCPPVKDNLSVRTRRSVNGNSSRTKISNQGNGNNRSMTRTRVNRPQTPEPETRIGVNVPISARQYIAEASSSRLNSRSRPSSSGGSIPSMMPIGLGDHALIRNVEAARRYNLDSIAEVLLALERIEQDDELTYEQLLALETNVFSGGLSIYDQHRDMRLDIDNMSYEELLALEEEMGTVVIAVPEEALSKCLRKSIYQLMPPAEGTMGCSGDEDDTKCSICQEEYAVGEEIGRLGCEHGYHVECINQWLRLKNWCPICKCNAATL